MKRPLRANNPAAVRETLVKVANEVRRGELSPQQGNSITASMNVILSSMRIDEQERRVNELEQLLQQLIEDRQNTL